MIPLLLTQERALFCSNENSTDIQISTAENTEERKTKKMRLHENSEQQNISEKHTQTKNKSVREESARSLLSKRSEWKGVTP